MVSASHRCAAGLAKASRPGVLPAYDEAPAAPRAVAVPRLVPGPPPRRDADRQAAGHAGQRLQPHRGAQPGRAQRVCAPRFHDQKLDGAAARGRPLAVLDFPGRRLRPHHLRHRQPAARRLHQLGRGIRHRRYRALLGKARKAGLLGPTAPAAGVRTLASSTARWNGWACSAT